LSPEHLSPPVSCRYLMEHPGVKVTCLIGAIQPLKNVLLHRPSLAVADFQANLIFCVFFAAS
jgi:hypothetical protein